MNQKSGHWIAVCLVIGLASAVGCGARDAVETEKSLATVVPQSPPDQRMASTDAAPPLANQMADLPEVPVANGVEPLPTRFDIAPTTAATEAGTLPLKADLSPERLADFLRQADIEMQNIDARKAEFIEPAKARQEMVRVSKLKLEAATRLDADPASSPAQQVLAVRGQLQSLSHLAALGDLKSAEALEKLATKQLENAEASIAQDSRLVLVGLALERLQNGTRKDAGEVMQLVAGLSNPKRTPDISVMMVLGQARAVLSEYGFPDEATRVRDQVVDLFAAHPDPTIASMALEIAGSPPFRELDNLLRKLERGEDVAIDQWRSTVDTLLVESPNLSAVQFVSSAALQAEANGREDLATATYESLQLANQLNLECQRQISVAMQARKSRRELLGQIAQLDLPSIDGSPLSLSSYIGKVVLMPFWTIQFPESLSVLQSLSKIRERYPDKVEIIGVNLDTTEAPIDEFLEQSPVKFRSFYSVTKTDETMANETVEQFGLVSMPFVVIVGPDGKIAGVDFTGRDLEPKIKRFVE